jgi:hypothetical protein
MGGGWGCVPSTLITGGCIHPLVDSMLITGCCIHPLVDSTLMTGCCIHHHRCCWTLRSTTRTSRTGPWARRSTRNTSTCWYERHHMMTPHDDTITSHLQATELVSPVLQK